MGSAGKSMSIEDQLKQMEIIANTRFENWQDSQKRIATLEASLEEESEATNALLAQRDEEESKAKACTHAYRELKIENNKVIAQQAKQIIQLCEALKLAIIDLQPAVGLTGSSDQWISQARDRLKEALATHNTDIPS